MESKQQKKTKLHFKRRIYPSKQYDLPTIREKELTYSNIPPPNRNIEKAKKAKIFDINSTDSKSTVDPTQ